MNVVQRINSLRNLGTPKLPLIPPCSHISLKIPTSYNQSPQILLMFSLRGLREDKTSKLVHHIGIGSTERWRSNYPASLARFISASILGFTVAIVSVPSWREVTYPAIVRFSLTALERSSATAFNGPRSKLYIMVS